MADQGRGGYAFFKAMFARQSDPYAGGDLPSATNALHGLLAISTALCLGFLPLEPVDDRLGRAGWLVAALVLALGGAGVVALAQRKRRLGGAPGGVLRRGGGRGGAQRAYRSHAPPHTRTCSSSGPERRP